MFNKFMLISLLLCGGCVAEEGFVFEEAPEQEARPGEVWVCHAPGESMHGKECDKPHNDDQCLAAGDSGRFCWLLNMSDCSSPRVLLYNEICK